MPRAVTALVLTVLAVALLVSFRPSPGRVTLAAPVVARSPVVPPRTPARGRRWRRHPGRRVVAGAAVQDPYGTVQVRVTLRGPSRSASHPSSWRQS